MRNLLLVISILLTGAASALAAPSCGESKITVEKRDINTAVPKDLKGAKIIVRTKDGKETEVLADDFKVVPRKQQFVTTKVVQIEKEPCEPKIVEVEKEVLKLVDKEPLKNRLSLLLGYGASQGLTEVTNTANYVEIESNIGLVTGIQYQRLLTERLSIGAQVQTNRTYLINAGFDF